MQKPIHPSAVQHRDDIDGLRAIAVCLVIVFHLNFQTEFIARHLRPYSARLGDHFGTLFAGGFVGVDVFFVISGYLISGILLRSLQEGRFSIVQFYERRIRRIVPALSVVLIFSTACGLLALLPHELSREAETSISALLSVSNFWFWLHSNYFDQSSSFAPLLHTWSLSVEEQFYIFFPPILYVLMRFGRQRLRTIIFVLTLCSLVASEYVVLRRPSTAFYMVYTRAWELFIGTLLAAGKPIKTNNLVRNMLAWVGLALIIGSGVFYNSHTKFPGLSALAPCVGAALLIMTGQTGTTVVGRLLSAKPVVFIGLISYSLYLWHWPIIVYNLLDILPGYSLGKGSILALTFVLGFLSWKYVEVPFRDGSIALNRIRIFGGAIAIFAVLIAANLFIVKSHGWVSRLTPSEARLATVAEDAEKIGDWGPGCFLEEIRPELGPTCLQMSGTKPNYLLFGSSNVADKWFGFTHVYPEVNFLEATASGCIPIKGLKTNALCQHLKDKVFEEFLPAHHVDHIILSGNWLDLDEKYIPMLHQTVSYLRQKGFAVTVLGLPPFYIEPLPRLLVLASRRDTPQLPARRLSPGLWKLDHELQAQVKMSGGDYVSVMKLMCTDDSCKTTEDGAVLQRDKVHMTNEGSTYLARQIRARHLVPMVAGNH